MLTVVANEVPAVTVAGPVTETVVVLLDALTNNANNSVVTRNNLFIVLSCPFFPAQGLGGI